MRYPATILVVAAALASCAGGHTIEVANDSDLPRRAEMVSVPLDGVRDAMGPGPVVVRDAAGAEVPYQITYDSLLIFPADVEAHSTAVYRLSAGTPAPVDTVVCGALYARRKDDMTWENDRSAYRAYGPALQASGERSFGFDIWTKSVTEPVVAERYRLAFDEDKSLHDDNGNGMDRYGVGPTLGAGTAALLDSTGAIVYPWAYETYSILDNGPLRFTVRLTYPADSTGVRETRLITLDRGEYLNRTTVTFEGLDGRRTLAPGIVIHRHNPDGYTLSATDKYMAYADLTERPDMGLGVIYVGVVAPQADTLTVQPLDLPVADAVGHLLAPSGYVPGSAYTYWWGSGWSKGSMPDWETWKRYLSDFSRRVRSPLKATVK